MNYEFGPFRIDVANRLLFRDGHALPLTPKVVETLVALVERGGQLVKKDDLIRIVWPDHTVEEGNLTQNIYLLRKMLASGSNGDNYIETVPRRGYRFVGEVRTSIATGTDLMRPLEINVQPMFEASEAMATVNRDVERSQESQRLFQASRMLLPAASRQWGRFLLVGAAVVTLGVLAYLAFLRTANRTETKASSRSAPTIDGFSQQHLTTSRQAYQAYIQGRSYSSKGTTPALEQAIQQFQEALRNDSNFALPYAGLAEAYALLGSHYDSNELNPRDAMVKAKEAAAKAIELNDSLAEAHAAFGLIKQRYDWDWSGAEKEFKRAIELDSNYAPTYQKYSLLLSALGRTTEAEARMKRARELNPQSLSIGKDLGDLFYLQRDYDQALEEYRRTLMLDPTDPLGVSIHRAMGWAYEFHGMHEQAIAEFIETARIQNVSPERLSAYRQAFDSAGTKGFWHKWLELQQERIIRGRINPFYLAQVYAFVGENDRALTYLNKSFEDRALDVPSLRSNPVFDELRKDGGYETLLHRISIG